MIIPIHLSLNHTVSILYHCHVTPIDQHINNGLYGAFTIDPKIPRAIKKEMKDYDPDYEKEGIGSDNIPTPKEVKDDIMSQSFEHKNEVYIANMKAFDCANYLIQLQKGVPCRVYLQNMLEFDTINNFHLHDNLFNIIQLTHPQTCLCQ
jgi:hypothetical protein